MKVPRAPDGLRKDLSGLSANDSYDIVAVPHVCRRKGSPHVAIGACNQARKERKKMSPFSLLEAKQGLASETRHK